VKVTIFYLVYVEGGEFGASQFFEPLNEFETKLRFLSCLVLH